MKPKFQLVALCALGMGCNAILFGPSLRVTAAGINDFMGIYSGPRLAFNGGMYDVARNLEV